MSELSVFLAVIVILATATGWLLGRGRVRVKEVCTDKRRHKFTQTEAVFEVQVEELMIEAIRDRLRALRLGSAGSNLKLANKLRDHQPRLCK